MLLTKRGSINKTIMLFRLRIEPQNREGKEAAGWTNVSQSKLNVAWRGRHLREGAKRKPTIWTPEFVSVYLWNSASATARPGVVQTNTPSLVPGAHRRYRPPARAGGCRGPRRGGGVRASTGQPEHACQGLLTTMDSSLASPNQFRAVHKLHTSHQLG